MCRKPNNLTLPRATLLQESRVFQVPQVSQDQWALQDLLDRVAWVTLDQRVHLAPPDQLAIHPLVSLAAQVDLENQVAMACLVNLANLVDLGLWVQEEHLAPLEALDLLDSLLLANLAHMACLEEWGQKVNPDIKDIQVFQVSPA